MSPDLLNFYYYLLFILYYSPNYKNKKSLAKNTYFNFIMAESNGL